MSPKLPILLSALLALPPAVRGDPAAAPGLMIVTTLEDAGAGSLREALETLNAGGIGEVDLRSVHGEIRLRSALPEVRQNVRLLGPDPARGRLLINGQGQWPILAFAAGSTSELHHLVLTNALATGYRHGAALSNAGVLLLASCEISGNRNLFGWGGGLFNQGDLRLTDCLLRGNVASGEPGTDGDSRPLNFTFTGVTPGGGGAGLGGALFHQTGRLEATNCLFLGNQASGGPGGSAVEGILPSGRGGGPEGGVPGALGIRASTGGFGSGGGGAFWGSTNSSASFGGFGGGHPRVWSPGFGDDLFAGGATLPFHTASAGSGAGAGIGGGLFARSGTVTLSRCRFESNDARGGPGGNGPKQGGGGGAGLGGAVFSLDADVRIEQCQFHGNTARGGNGGSTSDPISSEFGGPGGPGEGAGLFGLHGPFHITASAFVSNQVTGGVGGSGKDGGAGGPGRGGAIAVRGPESTFDRVLCQDNEARGGASGQGLRNAEDPGRAEGGAVLVASGELVTVNSTLSGNRAAGHDGMGFSLGFTPSMAGASLGGGLAVVSYPLGERTPFFDALDFPQPDAFARRIKTDQDPLTRFIRNQIETSIRTALTRWDGIAPLPSNLFFGVRDALNWILYSTELGPLWTESRFAAVSLRQETRDLLRLNPTGTDRQRLHRLLLEDAYPTLLLRIPALRSTRPTAHLQFSTIASNEVHQARTLYFLSPTETNGVVNGGGLFNAGGNLILEGMIVAGNRSATNADTGGELVSLRANLVQSPGTTSGLQAHDSTGVDPRLGPLQDNGGPSWTHALLAGSPALDALGGPDGPEIDQRGFPRPTGAGWDLGAFEGPSDRPPLPRIAQVGLEAQGGIRLRLAGPANSRLELQFSIDLLSWIAIGTFSPGETALHQPVGTHGYYRLRTP